MPLINQVLKPEELTAAKLAAMEFDAALEQYKFRYPQIVETLKPWAELTDADRQPRIDAMQQVLDDLVAQGVLGVGTA